MPKSTAVSKTAIEPLNTSKNKIINVLTPQAELAAANTKIKQLQKLLKAKDTPIFYNKLLTDTLRLIIVL